MKYLLDTNILLWYIHGDERLPGNLRMKIESDDAELHISIATLWEIGIKYGLKRLDLKPDMVSFFNKHILNGSYNIVDLNVRHIYQVALLPYHHRDPFDRLIYAQSRAENMTLLYTDVAFDLYK